MTPAQYKKLRESLGTQTEVAKRLGIHRVTLAKREAGTLTISPEAADAMTHQGCKRTKAWTVAETERAAADFLKTLPKRRTRKKAV